MESQVADRAESGPRWAEFHENLAYRMFNLVRKQNFGSKSHSGSEFFVFFEILGHLKKSWKFQNFILVPGVRKNDFTIFPEFFTRKIRNTEISSETTIPGISSEPTETRESRGNGFSVLRIFF